MSDRLDLCDILQYRSSQRQVIGESEFPVSHNEIRELVKQVRDAERRADALNKESRLIEQGWYFTGAVYVDDKWTRVNAENENGRCLKFHTLLQAIETLKEKE